MRINESNNIEDNNYNLDFNSVFSESWRMYGKLVGVGAVAVLLYGAAAQLVRTVIGALTGSNVFALELSERLKGNTDPESILYEVQELYANNYWPVLSSKLASDFLLLLAFPLAGGFMLVCRDMDKYGFVNFNRLFEGFKPYYWSRLMTLAVVYFILSKIALMFFFLPGIYVWVAAVIACPIVMFNDYDGVNALKASFKLVNKNWFTVFQILFVASLFGVFGYLLCGVGRIFTYPLVLVTVYVLYKYIVGFSDDEIEEIGQG